MAATLRSAANQVSGSASSATITVPVPAGTTQNDLILVYVAAVTAFTLTGTTGWTQVTTEGTGLPGYVFYRFAGASEPASYTFTGSVNQTYWVQTDAVIGADLTSPIRGSGGNSTTASGSTVAVTVSTAAGSNDLVVAYFSQRGNSDVGGASMSFPTGFTKTNAGNGAASGGSQYSYSQATKTPSSEGTSYTLSFVSSTTRLGGAVVNVAAGSPPQTISPTGIASSASPGTPSIAKGAVSVSPTGIASARALGTPTIGGAITLHPLGIASRQGFGTPTVTGGAVVVSPTGIGSRAQVGVPTVTGAVVIVPVGIPSGRAVGTPTMIVPIILSPVGIPSQRAVGVPTVNGTVVIAPRGIASREAFGLPSFGLVVTPTGIPSRVALGLPTVLGTTVVRPVGIPSLEASGTPTINLTVYIVGIGSAEAFGHPRAGHVLAPSHHGAYSRRSRSGYTTNERSGKVR
jgi:hypothetical protein